MQIQDHKTSMLESVVNVAVGYGVAVGSQIVIFPLFGIHIPLSDNLVIGLFFTAISIVRSFLLRRAFNWHSEQKLEREVTSVDTITVPAIPADNRPVCPFCNNKMERCMIPGVLFSPVLWRCLCTIQTNLTGSKEDAYNREAV